MGSSKQTQQQQQNKDPWGPAIPYLNQMFGDAQKLYQNPMPQYKGPLQGGIDPSMQQGFDMLKGIATGPNQSLDWLRGAMGGIQGIGQRQRGPSYAEQQLPAWMKANQAFGNRTQAPTAAERLGPTA